MDEPGSMVSPWGLFDALVAMVAAVLGGSLVASLIGAGKHPSLAQQVITNVPFWAALIAVPVVVTTRRGRGPVADLGLAVRPRDLLALPLGGFAQLVVGWAYSPFVDHDRLERPARDLARLAHGSGGKVLLVVMTVVLAPVAEEIFYRGLILRSLTRAMSPAVAAVVCGLLFGAMHFQPLQLLGLAAFGVLAATLALRTGRLGPAVLAHVGFNAVALWSLHVL